MKLRGARRSALVVAVVALAALAAACDTYPLQPSSPAYSQTDLQVGAGDEATNGSVVSVHYTGWFYDAAKTDKKGLVFDTTVGKDAFTFTLGAGGVIEAWDEGLVGMKVGGVRRLIVPPSRAYGSARYASIPPNATLIFEISLVSVAAAQ